MRIGGKSFDVALPLPGPHFLLNFLAAAAAAHRVGIAPERIAEAATTLKAARSRGQVVRLGRRVTLLDDSYNSNPFAVEAAVTALGMAAPGRRVVFLGDMLELGPTGPDLHRETGAKAAGVEETHAFADSTEAAAAAPSLVKDGDAVLVKGSRGARMERVVEALTGALGVDEA
jgi:UDP-N-acetylmuramoyl-tripeptide--D-alanyl-D-alanine ligase